MEFVNNEIISFFNELRNVLDNGVKVSSEVLRYISSHDITQKEISSNAIVMGDFKEIKLNYLMFTIKLIQFRKNKFYSDVETFLILLDEFKQQQVLMLNSFLSYNFDVINLDYKNDSLRLEILSLINDIDYCVKSLNTFKQFDYI